MATENTNVIKWLEENNASKFAEKFAQQGYSDLADVDDHAIDSIVGEEEPGAAKRLKRSLAQKKGNETEEPMRPPALPPGTEFDLGAPEVPSFDIPFSVPTALSTERTSDLIKSPVSITPNEWMTIALVSKSLHGYDMEIRPETAQKAVLYWKVPEGTDFFLVEFLEGHVESAVTYTEESSSYVSSGFDTETATVGYAFCAASVERSNKEKHAASSTTKTLHATGLWKYPRAKLFLKDCTSPSPKFIDALRTAVSAPDAFNALVTVFTDYGQIVSTEVLLGGMLYFQEVKTDVASATEDEEETTIKASVAGKFEGVSASAGVATGTASDEQHSTLSQDEHVGFTALGGDTTLTSNPGAWASTVKDPGLWAIIEKGKPKRTIDLLDDVGETELKHQVLEIWESHTQHAIGDATNDEFGQGFGKNVQPPSGGFVAAVRWCGDGSRGSVLLASGAKDQLAEGELGTAVGAAYSHTYHGGLTFIEGNSICLPVPEGGAYRYKFEESYGVPEGRIVFIPSDLHFGEWKLLDDVGGPLEGDGFQFVSIEAPTNGDRGSVQALLNGNLVAASSVHSYAESDQWIQRQSFCIPVPEGSNTEINFTPTYGNPIVKNYWMPIVGEHWKMMATEEISMDTLLGTIVQAETDGILHGLIIADEGQSGVLELYSGADVRDDLSKVLPYTVASVQFGGSPLFGGRMDFWIQYSSVMLPLQKGTSYTATLANNATWYKNATAKLFWTPIVRR